MKPYFLHALNCRSLFGIRKKIHRKNILTVFGGECLLVKKYKIKNVIKKLHHLSIFKSILTQFNV